MTKCKKGYLINFSEFNRNLKIFILALWNLIPDKRFGKIFSNFVYKPHFWIKAIVKFKKIRTYPLFKDAAYSEECIWTFFYLIKEVEGMRGIFRWVNLYNNKGNVCLSEYLLFWHCVLGFPKVWQRSKFKRRRKIWNVNIDIQLCLHCTFGKCSRDNVSIICM